MSLSTGRERERERSLSDSDTSLCVCGGGVWGSDANGALLVYDITDRDSFTKVRHWVKVCASL